MSEKFIAADMSQKEFSENQSMAIGMYKEGAEPQRSVGLFGLPTAGYGRLDEFGYFEYGLPVGVDGTVAVQLTEEF